MCTAKWLRTTWILCIHLHFNAENCPFRDTVPEAVSLLTAQIRQAIRHYTLSRMHSRLLQSSSPGLTSQRLHSRNCITHFARYYQLKWSDLCTSASRSEQRNAISSEKDCFTMDTDGNKLVHILWWVWARLSFSIKFWMLCVCVLERESSREVAL